MRAASNRRELTSGSIWKSLLLFALPLLAGSFVQQLYNTVDLIFVGNFIDKSASAAVGASSLLITCLVGVFGGIGVGSGIVIAQIFGSRNKQRLGRAIHNTAAMILVSGLLMMLLGYLLAPIYLRLVRTPTELLDSATGYLRIYFLSFLSVVTYNFGSGILRALGDSKSPLYAQLVGGLLNVAMDDLFIRVLRGGVNGVAWATLISQTAAAGMVLVCLVRLEPAYALRPGKIAFDREILKQTVSVGMPAGIQSLVITLSNVMVQYHINFFGEDSIAAFTAYFKVELLIYLPIVALGQSVMTFAGQNAGAGNWERVRKGTAQCAAMSMLLAAATVCLCLPLGEQLFRIFARDASVIQLGRQIIGVTYPFYFIYPIFQVFGDSMRGVGKSKVPMLLVLLNICLVRTALLFVIVPRVPNVTGVAVVYPITWALTSVCMVVYYLRFHRGKSKPEMGHLRAKPAADENT